MPAPRIRAVNRTLHRRSLILTNSGPPLGLVLFTRSQNGFSPLECPLENCLQRVQGPRELGKERETHRHRRRTGMKQRSRRRGEEEEEEEKE
jgi:hypothetical protein